MDPGRRARLQGKDYTRELTGPKFDPFTRVSKPKNPPAKAQSRSKYLTQDEQSEQYVAGEDKFVLKQSKKKADIRVRENRATPIDLLAFNLRHIDTDRDIFDDDEEDVEIDVPTPEQVIDALDAQQLKDLDSEITHYHTLEINQRNLEYWKALQTIARHRRDQVLSKGKDDRAIASVADDIDKILSPKTFAQLETLEGQIKVKLDSEEDIDTDYWEQLLKRLKVWKARAQVKKIYQDIKAARVELLKKTNPEKAAALEKSDESILPTTAAVLAGEVRRQEPVQKRPEAAKPFSKPPSQLAAQGSSAPPGTARFAQAPNDDFSQTTKALFEREVARGFSENEEIFTAEETVPGASAPKWAGKYRPRKPRYFNRVQMGYEWNKYNQTHYDHDNPPPKVVQGYKFNIFYPDLIDKTKAPTYKIIREHGRRRGESFTPAGEADTCLIRFIAGPPYEDIAFRIVDREWDYSAKKDRGFRSTFDKVRSPTPLPVPNYFFPFPFLHEDRWTNGLRFDEALIESSSANLLSSCRVFCSYTSSSRRYDIITFQTSAHTIPSVLTCVQIDLLPEMKIPPISKRPLFASAPAPTIHYQIIVHQRTNSRVGIHTRQHRLVPTEGLSTRFRRCLTQRLSYARSHSSMVPIAFGPIKARCGLVRIECGEQTSHRHLVSSLVRSPHGTVWHIRDHVLLRMEWDEFRVCVQFSRLRELSHTIWRRYNLALYRAEGGTPTRLVYRLDASSLGPEGLPLRL